MGAKTFTANQVCAAQLIASGGGGLSDNLGLAIYSASRASGVTGNVTDTNMFAKVGKDIEFFVSGTTGTTGDPSATGGAALFGGDLIISGSTYLSGGFKSHLGVFLGDAVVSGSLIMHGAGGIDKANIFMDANDDLVIVHSGSNEDIKINVLDSSNKRKAIHIDSSNSRIGMMLPESVDPAYTYHLSSSAGTITSFIVDGQSEKNREAYLGMRTFSDLDSSSNQQWLLMYGVSGSTSSTYEKLAFDKDGKASFNSLMFLALIL